MGGWGDKEGEQMGVCVCVCVCVCVYLYVDKVSGGQVLAGRGGRRDAVP